MPFVKGIAVLFIVYTSVKGVASEVDEEMAVIENIAYVHLKD